MDFEQITIAERWQNKFATVEYNTHNRLLAATQPEVFKTEKSPFQRLATEPNIRFSDGKQSFSGTSSLNEKSNVSAFPNEKNEELSQTSLVNHKQE